MANSTLKISPSNLIFAFIQPSASSTVRLQLKEISIPIVATSKQKRSHSAKGVIRNTACLTPKEFTARKADIYYKKS